jgi:hypothetical protein
LADVRRYPASLNQLIAPIVFGTDKALSGTIVGATIFTYSFAEVSRWSGPYINEDAAAVLATGFGWKFQNTLFYDGYGVSGTVPSGTAQKYIVLTVGVTDQANALALDAMFDDGDLNAGAIRYRVCSTTGCTAGAADTVKFLLMPVY